MLTIIDANATLSPSRAYAEAAWRANPQLSPSWWRENGGLTHSKIALDSRQVAVAPRLLQQGMNLLLATPETMPSSLPDGVIAVVTTTNVQAAADYLLYSGALDDEPSLVAVLVALEQRVAQGTLQAYGVADATLGSLRPRYPLHRLLELAAQATEQAWGRKKRPSLRLLLAPMDVLDWQLLFTPNTLHKTEAVSPLELAARLGLWVLVAPRAIPGQTASPVALAALTSLAESEARLHHQLQGQWPHVARQPVFSVLQLLQAGQPPWPTPQAAQHWRAQVWPRLAELFGQLPAAGGLLTQWQALLPHVDDLAAAAAAPLAHTALQQLALAEPWAGLTPQLQQLALLASVPGVGAVVVPPSTDVTPLLALPDYPDVGALLSPR